MFFSHSSVSLAPLSLSLSFAPLSFSLFCPSRSSVFLSPLSFSLLHLSRSLLRLSFSSLSLSLSLVYVYLLSISLVLLLLLLYSPHHFLPFSLAHCALAFLSLSLLRMLSCLLAAICSSVCLGPLPL